MFALRRAPLRASAIRVSPQARPLRPHHRHFFLDAVGNGFLDLALALPLPPSFPIYSSTIIFVTIAGRLAMVPVTLWGMGRTRRQQVIVPKMEAAKTIISKRILTKMQEEGLMIKKNEDKIPIIYREREKAALNAHYNQLLRDYRCTPIPTMIVPVVAQIPFFIGFTFLLNHLSGSSTPFESESFLTLTSLSSSDPTMALPIIVGCLTMAQTESGNWLLTAAQREETRLAEQAYTGKQKLGQTVKGLLRGLSLVRVILTAMAPGSVAVFWMTSAVYGLFQTWVLNWLERRRAKKFIMPEPVVDQTTSRKKKRKQKL